MNTSHTVVECGKALTSLEDALYVIGGKWKLRILGALRDNGRKRFNDLQRSIKGISPRVLSGELKEMEMNGIVQRTVVSGNPAIVAYELTAYSQTLEEVFMALTNWGAAHRNRIREAHKNGDTVAAYTARFHPGEDMM